MTSEVFSMDFLSSSIRSTRSRSKDTRTTIVSFRPTASGLRIDTSFAITPSSRIRLMRRRQDPGDSRVLSASWEALSWLSSCSASNRRISNSSNCIKIPLYGGISYFITILARNHRQIAFYRRFSLFGTVKVCPPNQIGPRADDDRNQVLALDESGY